MAGPFVAFSSSQGLSQPAGAGQNEAPVLCLLGGASRGTGARKFARGVAPLPESQSKAFARLGKPRNITFS
jgi:hypothetical protein